MEALQFFYLFFGPIQAVSLFLESTLARILRFPDVLVFLGPMLFLHLFSRCMPLAPIPAVSWYFALGLRYGSMGSRARMRLALRQEQLYAAAKHCRGYLHKFPTSGAPACANWARFLVVNVSL